MCGGGIARHRHPVKSPAGQYVLREQSKFCGTVSLEDSKDCWSRKAVGLVLIGRVKRPTRGRAADGGGSALIAWLLTMQEQRHLIAWLLTAPKGSKYLDAFGFGPRCGRGARGRLSSPHGLGQLFERAAGTSVPGPSRSDIRWAEKMRRPGRACL